MGRSGAKTSEFKVAALAIVGGVVLILAGHAQEGSALLSAAVLGYTVSRGLAKKE